MVDEQLKGWIKEQISQGFTHEQISEHLINNGYNTADVNEALNSLDNKPKSKRLFIIIGAVIFIALIVGAVYFFSGGAKTTETINAASNQTVNIGESGVGANVNIEINAEIEASSSCGDMACFNQKFSTCAVSNLTLTAMDNLIYYYEILGPKNSSCEVKSRFLANPNPSFIGKDMTCLYDNNIDFETSVADISRCQGPLFDSMMSP